MGWLGLDDTDTLTDGCTTYTLHRLLNALPEGIIASNLSLVRLWPFAEQRTRGNAAVAVELSTEDEPRLMEFLEAYWNEYLAPLRGLVSQSDQQRVQAPTDPCVWSIDPTEQLKEDTPEACEVPVASNVQHAEKGALSGTMFPDNAPGNALLIH